MTTVQLSQRDVLEYIILGIKNERYQAAINIAQDTIDEIDKTEKQPKGERNNTCTTETISELEAVILNNKSLTIANKQLQQLIEKEELENAALKTNLKNLSVKYQEYMDFQL